MNPTKFEELLSNVGPLIVKASQKKEPIGPSERLCVTLLLAKLSKTLVSRIIKEMTRVLWKVLSERGFIEAPSFEEEWVETADQLGKKGTLGTV